MIASLDGKINSGEPIVRRKALLVRENSELDQVMQYVKMVSGFPILTELEERSLLVDFFENQNIKAGHTLLNSHLRLVVKIAMEYKKFHSSLMDLIAEGNLGLLKALKKFSLERQVRFATYAMFWIKASIKNFLTKSISSVKAITTNTQKKLLFHLSKAKKYLGIKGRVSDDESKKLCEMLYVSKDDLQNHERMMLEIKESSTNDQIHLNNEVVERGDFLCSKNESLEDDIALSMEQKSLSDKIKSALSHLSEREAEIVTCRVLKPNKYTLDELSKKFLVSKERIRQIQENALKKLKKVLEGERGNIL